jgi:predicted nuclease with TOPRIM domain
MLFATFEHAMTEVESIVLEHLRHIRGAVDSTREDIREIKGRLGILESQYAHMSNRIDRLDARVERIEQRLELTEV